MPVFKFDFSGGEKPRRRLSVPALPWTDILFISALVLSLNLV
ncbi:MAG: hypothetical protein R3D84_13285 [Paracoccaceae bacterium]